MRAVGLLLSAVVFSGFVGVASAAETESAVARGGRLYDKWFAETKGPKPETNHAAYPAAGKYGKADSWRCKECHGWDGKGKDGAYSKGGHFSGIAGITASAGKDPAAIATLLRDKNHGYTEAQLSAKDVGDLSLFVSKGQVDYSKYIDTANNKSKGAVAKGEVYFNTLCANCHGPDGKKITTGPALGSVSDNGVEMMHKVLNGQPAENMPALRALDHQIAADIVAHLQTLPK